MDYLYDLSLFFLKAVIAAGGVIAAVLIPAMALRAGGLDEKEKRPLKVEPLRERRKARALQFRQKTMDKKKLKAHLKALKKEESARAGAAGRPSCFVLSFQGDIMASQTEALREEISLVLELAGPKDEAILLLESRGGSVAHYGLGASQLERLRARGIPLAVCVDRFAGSGGYLMACAGNPLIAAPFAFIGSIGVLFGLPNIHEFLKKRDISYEEITAGKHKRTLTPFGKATDEKRGKLKEQLELIHGQFKAFVKSRRKGIDMERAATGEAWLAEEAIKLGLVDKIQCSDDFLMERLKTHELYKISLKPRPALWEKITKRPEPGASEIFERLLPKEALFREPFPCLSSLKDLEKSGRDGFFI